MFAVLQALVLLTLTLGVRADLPSFYQPDNYYAPHEGQPGREEAYDDSFMNPHSAGFLSDSDWGDMDWGIHTGFRPRCVEIPSNFSLCRDIGYEQMRLPNLLDHESLAEATEQSRPWNHLTNLHCHPDTKMFLCSLFAPICLEMDQAIYPCRSLCEAVRGGCEPRMRERLIEWPEMLNCDRFPLDNDMCVKKGVQAEAETRCSACNQPITFESIVDNYCSSEIVMKVRLKRGKKKQSRIEISTARRKKFIKEGNAGSLSKRAKRELKVMVEGAAKCECEESFRDVYLVSGALRDGQFYAQSLHRWERENEGLKRAMRAIRKNANLCDMRGVEILTSDVIQDHGEPAAAEQPSLLAETDHVTSTPATTTSPTTTTTTSPPPRALCQACRASQSAAEIGHTLCQADVIVRMRLRSGSPVGPDTRLTAADGGVKIYQKPAAVSERQLRGLDLVIQGTSGCDCLMNFPDKYVLAGRLADGRLHALGIYQFGRSSEALKQALSDYRKQRLPCQQGGQT